MRRDARSAEAQAYRRLYKTARWQRTRAAQLQAQPLCEMCLAQGRVTAATICDHVNPDSKKTEEGFFAGPFQSLCDDPRYRCHSREKQRIEKGGKPRATIGVDGWPVT